MLSNNRQALGKWVIISSSLPKAPDRALQMNNNFQPRNTNSMNMATATYAW